MRRFWIVFISIILCIGIVGSVYGEIKLEVWNSDHNPDTQKWYKEVLVPAFEKSHPGVKVEMVFTPWGPQYTEKILTSYAAGKGPDILMGGAEFIDDFVLKNIVIDITDRVKQWSDYKNFDPATTANQIYEGKIYGIVLTSDSRHFLYRKDLFKEVGLDPNKPPSTWEQFRAAALKLTKKEGNTIVRMGCSIDMNYQTLNNIVYQNGGEMINSDKSKALFNSPEAVEALEFWGKLFNEIAPPGTVLTAPMPLFAAGKIAISQWSGTPTIADVRMYAPQLLDQVGIAPPLKRKKQIVLCYNNWLGIGSQSKNPDMAWEFLKFHLRPTYIAQYAHTLYRLPGLKTALNLPLLAQDPFIRALARQRAQYGMSTWTAPEFRNIRNVIDPELDNFLRGKKTSKQALDDAVANVNKILAQYKK